MPEQDGPAVDDVVLPESNEPAPLLEEEIIQPTPETKTPHPLEPNGKRFEQVYARAKQAEREVADLRAKTEALEARLNGTTKPVEEEYTPAQLESFIAENRITRADATAYREKLLLKKAVDTAKTELKQEFSSTDRTMKLTQGIAEYVQMMPSIQDKTSPDRARLDDEFDFVASVQGVDVSKVTPVERRALELLALRNVFGSIETVRKRTNVTTKLETNQEFTGGTPPTKKANPDQDLLNKLTPREVEHYKRMIGGGVYAGWKDVVAELKFDKNNRPKPQDKK
jgi:hypothetical protein